MHYYPKNIGDYRRDTMNLSLLEHGVYNTLIDHYLLNEKPFSTDKNEIYFIVGAKTENEIKAVDILLKMFFRKTKKYYYHKRCDEEIAKYHAKSDKARQSINIRWNKERNTNEIRSYNGGNTNQEPITKNQEPIKTHYVEYAQKVKKEYPNSKDMTVKQIEEHFKKKKRTEKYLDELLEGLKHYPKWFANVTKDFPNRKHKDLKTFLNQEAWKICLEPIKTEITEIRTYN